MSAVTGIVVGIDVAKDTLEVATSAGEHWQVGNDTDGQEGLRDYFARMYVAPQMLIAVAGHIDHAQVRDLIETAWVTVYKRLPVPPARTMPFILAAFPRSLSQSISGTHRFALVRSSPDGPDTI